MRLAVVNLTAGQLSGGYWKYLHHILPLLNQDPQVEHIYLLVPEGLRFTVPATITEHSFPAHRILAGGFDLRKTIQSLGVDVVFLPTARWMDLHPIPVVAMVRNMEPLAAPFEGHTLRGRAQNLARAVLAKRACSKADRVIAVSKHVRDFLVHRWQIPFSKIGIVVHGVEAPLGPAETLRPERISLEDQDDFLFTAGSIRPARGLEDAISALRRLHASNPRLKLAIAGRPDSDTVHWEKQMRQLVKRLDLEKWIIWAGQLSEREMAWCYHHCRAFIMSSRVEACPNIALEAISYGAVCVSVDLPPMPEFFGADAVYYPARNPAVLAEQVERVLSFSGVRRKQIRTSGKNRAARQTWSLTAAQTIAELRKCLPATGI